MTTNLQSVKAQKPNQRSLSNELFAALFSKWLLYSIMQIISSSMIYFSFQLQFNEPKKGRGFQPTKVAPNRGPGNRENVSDSWIYCEVGLLCKFFIFPLKEHIQHFFGKKCRIWNLVSEVHSTKNDLYLKRVDLGILNSGQAWLWQTQKAIYYPKDRKQQFVSQIPHSSDLSPSFILNEWTWWNFDEISWVKHFCPNLFAMAFFLAQML